MTAQKYNARDVAFQIQDPSSGSWVALAPGGINTFSRGHSEKETDTTTFASGGDAESLVMERSKTLKLEGFHLIDQATGLLDAGQQLVETLADQKGTASLGGFRYAAPGATVWTVWANATAKLGDIGGGNNDEAGWSVTMTRSGPTTTAPRP